MDRLWGLVLPPAKPPSPHREKFLLWCCQLQPSDRDRAHQGLRIPLPRSRLCCAHLGCKWAGRNSRGELHLPAGASGVWGGSTACLASCRTEGGTTHPKALGRQEGHRGEVKHLPWWGEGEIFRPRFPSPVQKVFGGEGFKCH